MVGFSSELATGTQLTVPATISSGGATYTITELADNCLNATDNGCPLLSSITLPSTVKNIGKYALRGQSSLTSINFPDVEIIHTGAFYGCTSLKEALLGLYTTINEKEGENHLNLFSDDVPLEKLTFSRAETDKANSDGDNISGVFFQGIKTLKEYHLPALKQLKWGGDFRGLPSLTNFDAPLLENVKSGTFECKALTSLYLPSVKTIESGGITNCDNLVTIECPNCEKVETQFASNNKSLKTLIFPGMVNVADYSFQSQTTATTIYLPKAKTIGQNAFTGCTSLTDLTAPNIETVGDYAFMHCSSLASVNMPKVETIKGSAFMYCENLSSVTMPVLKVLDGSAFTFCTSLTELHLPKLTTLVQVGITAPNLKVLDLPELSTREGYSMYLISGNNGNNTRNTLEEANVPKLETLMGGDFSNCVNLKKVNVEGAKTLGSGALSGCTSLQSLSLPNVTSLEGGALSGCTSLQSLSLPNVTSLQGGAFSGCTALKYLHLGPGITDVSSGQIFISNDKLDHDIHIWLDYKGGVITAPSYMTPQKDVVIYHVDYSLLQDYMKDDTWKNFIFERTLDDASEVPFTQGRYYFSLRRALKSAEWSTLVLPFSLTADEVKAMFGTDVKLAEYTGSTRSTVSADGYDLNFQRTASITAGKPVLICGAAEPGDNTYLCGKMALGTDTQYGTKVESNVSQTDPSADADNHFNLQGTYIHNSSFILSGDYYLGTGNKLHHAKSGKALGSARMVVRYQGTNAQAKLMGLDFDGITTAIDEIKLDEATRTTLHASSKGKEPRYNLTGQRVGANYKGVVIVNGKKMLNI